MNGFGRAERNNRSLSEIFVRNMEARRNAEQVFRDYPRGHIEEYIKPATVSRWDRAYKDRNKDTE